MSNRRKLIRPGAWKDKRAPQPGTVQTWFRNAEEEGAVQRVGVKRTGKPGRPATVWDMTPEGAAEHARAMTARELASARLRAVRNGSRGTIWLAAVQAEIERRSGKAKRS